MTEYFEVNDLEKTLYLSDNTTDVNKTTNLPHFPSYLFTENVLRKT